jgi:hypothetical protein
MSAVSSVSTPGVLVTTMPRCLATARSMWSTPVPNEAISFSFGPAWLSTRLSIRSVTVGTNTSAAFTASTIWAAVSGVSSALRRVSNSSMSRVSIASGSFRVTITNGFFLALGGMYSPLSNSLGALSSKRPRPPPDLALGRKSGLIHVLVVTCQDLR